MPIELTPIPAPPADARHRIGKWCVTTAPTGFPVSLSDCAEHLRIQTDFSVLTPLLGAAVDYAEDMMSIALMPRTILANFYDGEPLILPRGPLLEVLSIIDGDDTYATSYELAHVGNRAQVIELEPDLTYPISIQYRAGYTSAAAIPASILLAIKAHVGTLYENRESVSDKGNRLAVVPHSLEAFYKQKSRKPVIG